MEDAHALLSKLIEEHYALLYRYAYRLTGSESDAEDLTQQAFLIAQTKLNQLRDADRAKSWLCAVLRNAHLKDLRDLKGNSFHSLEFVPEPIAQTTPEPELESEQLQQILNEMPEEYRSPVILFYFGEFSYKEIAEQMNVPMGTIMSRLARAKSYLRQRLNPSQGFDGD